MLYFVYSLIDPRTHQPFYVGITHNPNQRMLQHLAGRDTNERKNARISGLQSQGLLPKMQIVEVVEAPQEAQSREVHWIRTYEQQGFQLTNIIHATPTWQRDEAALKPQDMIMKSDAIEMTMPHWNYADWTTKTASAIVPGDQIFDGRWWRPSQVFHVEKKGPRICISYINWWGRKETHRYDPDCTIETLDSHQWQK